MSTIDRPQTETLPPLVPGQRLDRATFHARYEAMPPGTRAELIGGVVYMPSPVSYDHSDVSSNVLHWLGFYRRRTPGVREGDNASVFLDDQGEPQPDAHLRIQPECGGQIRYEGRYIAGAPELVAEVARTSLPIDLGPKRADYERTGVREYMVVDVESERILWFARREGRLVPLSSGTDGLFRSEVFPGLWLDPVALFADDLDGLIAALERGLATPEHAAFVARLADSRAQGPP
jgi:Uma2 family endonuclease